MWVAIFICQYYCSSLELLVSLVWLHHPNRLLRRLITCLATLSFGLNFSHDCFMDDKVNSLWYLRGVLIEVVFCKIRCVAYCWNDSRPILWHNNVIGLIWSCLLACKHKNTPWFVDCSSSNLLVIINENSCLLICFAMFGLWCSIINPLRTVVAYMRQGNTYFTVRKQIILTSPAFTL